jgi:RHS repeat-associated protein
MPGRSFSSGSYRYGFQGQEKDDEIKGDGNSINYKYRVHDPRLGRFLSVDPLAPDYPSNSPYAFCENRVIDGVDLEGKEREIIDFYMDNDGKLIQLNKKENKDFGPMGSGILIRLEFENKKKVELYIPSLISGKESLQTDLSKSRNDIDIFDQDKYVKRIVNLFETVFIETNGNGEVDMRDIIKNESLVMGGNFGGGLQFKGSVIVLDEDNLERKIKMKIYTSINQGANLNNESLMKIPVEGEKKIKGSEYRYRIRFPMRNDYSIYNIYFGFKSKKDANAFIETYLNTEKKAKKLTEGELKEQFNIEIK